MNNLWTLIKVDLRETLDVRKFKENKGKSISFIVFLGLMLILGLVISIIYNLMFTYIFSSEGVNVIYSTLFMGAITSMLALTTSIFKVKSIFVGKDYEMLRSMPIKKTEIIAAKIINLYLIELLYAAIIMIPNIVINVIFTMDFTYLAFGVLVIILIPALPMMIACLFSMFITLIADRYKFGNVINFILYFALFILIMFFSFFMGMNGTEASTGEAIDSASYIAMAKGIAWLNPTLFLVEQTYTTNYLFIFAFVGVNIILCIGVVLFISLFFDRVHESINTFKSSNVYVRKKLESKGQFKTLVSHEYKRLFTSKYYFINSISSGICAIVMSGIITFMLANNFKSEGMEEFVPYIKEYAYVGSLFIMFGIGIATPASASISIEGAKFWMVKAFPIDYKKYLNAKLFVSITVLGVCSIIASILIIAIIQPTVYSSILLIVIPLIYVFLVSTLGLLINLSYYKLKWKNEQECVKSSAGVVIAMFLDWLVMFVLAGILIGFTLINSYLAGAISIVVLVLGALLLYYLTIHNADYKIDKIEEF